MQNYALSHTIKCANALTLPLPAYVPAHCRAAYTEAIKTKSDPNAYAELVDDFNQRRWQQAGLFEAAAFDWAGQANSSQKPKSSSSPSAIPVEQFALLDP